ncbi:MAG: hypothetical protein WC707_06245 [Candidatus Babeliaceae bacterium]|jgi:hypothetical protein
MVNSLFLWINFFILLGLGIYLFYTYGLPIIKQDIANKKRITQEIHDQIVINKHEKTAILRNIDSQKVLFDALYKHLDTWKIENNRYYHECLADKQLVREKLEKKYKIQAKQEALRKAYLEIMPDVFEKLDHDLKKNFASRQERERYNISILNVLK